MLPPAATNKKAEHLPENTPAQPDWKRLAASAEFKKLIARKKALVVPAFLFFFVYYLALPVSVGYAPKLMSTPVLGAVTLAYLFALSQFLVGGILAWLYGRAAAKWDLLTKDVLDRARELGGAE
jgi:uncharacterized membrane protein (DUF485 family)